MKPKEVRDQKADWIANTLHVAISKLQQAAEKLGRIPAPMDKLSGSCRDKYQLPFVTFRDGRGFLLEES